MTKVHVLRLVQPARRRVVLAFAAVYFIWGSTYLAIRFAIETMPPLLMSGVRFMIAGTLLFAWARGRGAAAPTRLQWRSAVIVGAFLLLGGNGGVVWAEQRVPSGLAALLIASVPLWMTLLAWMLRQSPRPSPRVGLGLLLGMTGVGLLVGMRGAGNDRAVDPVGAMALVLASLSWAYGSLWSRRAPLPSSPILATAMEMLAGGALMFLAGTLRGEWTGFDPGAISARSFFAWLYLLAFGSLVAFTAYIYLLGASTPARVSTYGFVNPLVAVLLGWGIAAETLTSRTLVSASIILTGVVLIITARTSGSRPSQYADRPQPAAQPIPSELRQAAVRLDEKAQAQV
jgi:drug/metabolite transporter (DMT)-like permease